jgi:hypothetical protein
MPQMAQKQKMTWKQKMAYDSAFRTLRGIKWAILWERVFKGLGPKIDANQMMRVRSHRGASTKGLV